MEFSQFFFGEKTKTQFFGEKNYIVTVISTYSLEIQTRQMKGDFSLCVCFVIVSYSHDISIVIWCGVRFGTYDENMGQV